MKQTRFYQIIITLLLLFSISSLSVIPVDNTIETALEENSEVDDKEENEKIVFFTINFLLAFTIDKSIDRLKEVPLFTQLHSHFRPPIFS